MDILPDKSVQALQRVVRGFQQDRDLRGYAVFALGFRPDETKTFISPEASSRTTPCTEPSKT